jgi:hypothetical protein
LNIQFAFKDNSLPLWEEIPLVIRLHAKKLKLLRLLPLLDYLILFYVGGQKFALKEPLSPSVGKFLKVNHAKS